MEDLQYYIGIIAVIVVGVFIIKKVTGCIIRIITTVVALAVLAYLLNALGYLNVF